MRKILVPFDGSDNALRALNYAVTLAKAFSSVEIELLHVLDPMPPYAYGAATALEIEQRQRDEAERILQPARKILDTGGIPYQAHNRVGSAAGKIALHARETQCDAIVMGTRGMGPIANLMVGSVSARVVHLAEVPVTLVK